MIQGLASNYKKGLEYKWDRDKRSIANIPWFEKGTKIELEGHEEWRGCSMKQVMMMMVVNIIPRMIMTLIKG